MILNSTDGWQNKKGRAKWIAVGFLSLWIIISDVKASEIAEIRPSDMDLIEFLGGWETEDGQWVDPALLDAVFAEEGDEQEEPAEPDLKSGKKRKRQDAALKEKTRKIENKMREGEK